MTTNQPLTPITLHDSGSLVICASSKLLPNLGRYGEKSLPQMICEANSDLIANWLALEGSYGTMRFIQEHAPEVPFKNEYVNKCHLCNDIFTRTETRGVLKLAYKKSTEISLRPGSAGGSPISRRGLYSGASCPRCY
jgi:hypothetical protein